MNSLQQQRIATLSTRHTICSTGSIQGKPKIVTIFRARAVDSTGQDGEVRVISSLLCFAKDFLNQDRHLPFRHGNSLITGLATAESQNHARFTWARADVDRLPNRSIIADYSDSREFDERDTPKGV